MNTYTLEPLTPDTLADAYALHPDREEAARLLAGLRERVAAGGLRPDQFLILRSGRGVEGVALIPSAVRVPVFPRFRPDVTPEGMTLLARAIRERGGPGRTLLLQDDLAPLNAGAVLGAGWVGDAPVHVMYETDLRARPYPLAHGAVEGGDELRRRPDVSALLEVLGQSGWEGSEGWTLVALPGDDGRPVALGAFGSSTRPGWASLNMIGVHPEARGQGHGSRLHAHLLARAAEHFTHHGGGTEADNLAMRRVFEKSGCRHVATQMYFRQP